VFVIKHVSCRLGEECWQQKTGAGKKLKKVVDGREELV
jgi:hypothetical protein